MAEFLALSAFTPLKTEIEKARDDAKNHAQSLTSFQDAESVSFTKGAQGWSVDAETAKTAAEAAQTAAETAKTAAETAQTAAETAETGAETAETNAGTSATNAATSESNAATSETNSETWAEGTDGAVGGLGGTHSSKGWAQIAEAAATGSINLGQPQTGTAINVVGGETDDFQFAEDPVDGFLVVNGAILSESDYTIAGDTITLDVTVSDEDSVRWFPTEEAGVYDSILKAEGYDDFSIYDKPTGADGSIDSTNTDSGDLWTVQAGTIERTSNTFRATALTSGVAIATLTAPNDEYFIRALISNQAISTRNTGIIVNFIDIDNYAYVVVPGIGSPEIIEVVSGSVASNTIGGNGWRGQTGFNEIAITKSRYSAGTNYINGYNVSTGKGDFEKNIDSIFRPNATVGIIFKDTNTGNRIKNFIVSDRK